MASTMTIPNTTSSTAIDAAPTTSRKPEEDEQVLAPTSDAAAAAAAAQNNDDDVNDDGDDDDDDDVTVIFLDAEPAGGLLGGVAGAGAVALDWIEQQGPEMEARRRVILLRELQRTQRVSCCHFVLLCAVPVVLLLIVLTAILDDSEVCASDVTYCEYEPRSLTNAFTTRCICDPIPILRTDPDGRY
jgi:hypothetical protein